MEKKKISRDMLSDLFDIGNSRLKESEKEELFNLASDPEFFKKLRTQFKEISTVTDHDFEKYRRITETNYSLEKENGLFSILEDIYIEDDDGEHFNHKRVYKTGRQIIDLLKKLKDK